MAVASASVPEAASLEWVEAPGSSDRHRQWKLRGTLDHQRLVMLERDLRRQLPVSGGRLSLDLSGVDQIDSAGAAALVELWRLGRVRGFEVALEGIRPETSGRLALYRVQDDLQAAVPEPGLVETLGERVYQSRASGFAFLVLAADVTIASILSLVRPRRMRWNALIEQSSLMGSQAFGIVGLISFLVGLTLAFQSAHQLRQFGAAIYVATLTAISVVSEMGPLITAILVAGRSGSSIASEVATMKINEEIDALQVMGIPFVEFVAVPRLLALLLTVPLLTLMADVMGIAGGWIVAMTYLDMASAPYVNATIDALVIRDVFQSMIKAVSFAWGIGLIGLYYGARVSGGAQEVGRATTASVVSAIFFIIVADSMFSILFYVVL